MIEIELNNIKKNYGIKNILDGFNLRIKTGERVALIGQNGSGKSSLIKMILDEDKDYSGNIKLGASIKIGYIPQNIVFEDINQNVLDYFEDGNIGSSKVIENNGGIFLNEENGTRYYKIILE